MSLNAFYQWVSDNNPSEELLYGKGWWDFIEFNYKLFDEFDISEASIAETFIINTPPPCEQLEMPISNIKIGMCSIQIKCDFSNIIGPKWFMLVERDKAGVIPGMEAFTERNDEELRFYFKDKFLKYADYSADRKEFSLQLKNEFDVYGALQLIAYYTR